MKFIGINFIFHFFYFCYFHEILYGLKNFFGGNLIYINCKNFSSYVFNLTIEYVTVLKSCIQAFDTQLHVEPPIIELIKTQATNKNRVCKE